MAQQANLQDLYDIYGMWHTPWWQTRLFYGAVASVLVLLFAWVLRKLYRRWQQKKTKTNPWQRALKSLESVRQKAHTMNPKEFYSSLTAILKQYINERYAFDVAGKTDDELIVFLASTDFPSAQLEPMRHIFNRGVTMKFAAQAQLDRAIMLDDCAMSMVIIQQTIPQQQ